METRGVGDCMPVCISRSRPSTNPGLLGRDASNQAAWILDSCRGYPALFIIQQQLQLISIQSTETNRSNSGRILSQSTDLKQAYKRKI